MARSYVERHSHLNHIRELLRHPPLQIHRADRTGRFGHLIGQYRNLGAFPQAKLFARPHFRRGPIERHRQVCHGSLFCPDKFGSWVISPSHLESGLQTSHLELYSEFRPIPLCWALCSLEPCKMKKEAQSPGLW